MALILNEAVVLSVGTNPLGRSYQLACLQEAGVTSLERALCSTFSLESSDEQVRSVACAYKADGLQACLLLCVLIIKA